MSMIILNQVGLDSSVSKRYPHQLSGGQRARIGIARALAARLDFLVCDESVAALDVSIRAQVLNLFVKLRQDFDLIYMFVSYDLGVVEHISDRIAVMYLGRFVEMGEAQNLIARPNHPYTQALVGDIPTFETGKKTYHGIKGGIRSPMNPPTGCHFHPRCPQAMIVAASRCRPSRRSRPTGFRHAI